MADIEQNSYSYGGGAGFNTGYTQLISKTKYFVKFLYVLSTFREHRESQGRLDAIEINLLSLSELCNASRVAALPRFVT